MRLGSHQKYETVVGTRVIFSNHPTVYLNPSQVESHPNHILKRKYVEEGKCPRELQACVYRQLVTETCEKLYK